MHVLAHQVLLNVAPTLKELVRCVLDALARITDASSWQE